MRTARLDPIDALRGVALFGVLLQNLPWFGRSPLGGTLPAGALEVALAWLVRGKAWGVLALLFGAGIELQAARFGPAAPGVHARRMAALLALGVAHAVLVWPGDVLVTWALVGLVVGAGRRRPRTVAAVALGLAVALAAIGPHVAARDALQLQSVRTWSAWPWSAWPWSAWPWSGWSGLTARLRAVLAAWSFVPDVLPGVTALAALGIWLARAGPAPRWWLLPLGLALSLPPALGNGALARVSGALGTPVLALGYASVFALAWPRLRPLAPAVAVGRMSLSNYLAQSLIGTALALAVPDLRLVATLPAAVGIWTALALASEAWLARFGDGPAERLWRRVAHPGVSARGS